MNPLQQVVRWLRAGYPQGIPQGDYIALFGVLHHNLTDAELEQVITCLRDGEGGLDPDITSEKIKQYIREQVNQHPTDEDVHRVMAHLAQGGWPLAPLPDHEVVVED